MDKKPSTGRILFPKSPLPNAGMSGAGPINQPGRPAQKRDMAAPKKLSPLGKGLESILPKSYLNATDSIVSIPVDEIVPNRYQPRLSFDSDSITQLAESIKQHGLNQPILVRPRNGKYELIAGERRYQATKVAGFETISAVIKDVSDREALQLALVENIDRENLNPIEEAKAFLRLSQEFNLTHQEIADTFKRSRSAITNSLRLLKLSHSIQRALMSGKLTRGHARALLRLETEEEQQAFLDKIGSGMTVRDIEKETTDKIKQPKERADFSQFEKILTDKFSLKPKIKGTWSKGTVQLKYKSKEDLENILNVFGMLQK